MVVLKAHSDRFFYRWSMRLGVPLKLRLAEGITRGARRHGTAVAAPLQITVSLRKCAMLTLNINGQDQELDVAADMPL